MEADCDADLATEQLDSLARRIYVTEEPVDERGTFYIDRSKNGGNSEEGMSLDGSCLNAASVRTNGNKALCHSWEKDIYAYYALAADGEEEPRTHHLPPSNQ